MLFVEMKSAAYDVNCFMRSASDFGDEFIW